MLLTTHQGIRNDHINCIPIFIQDCIFRARNVSKKKRIYKPPLCVGDRGNVARLHATDSDLLLLFQQRPVHYQALDCNITGSYIFA